MICALHQMKSGLSKLSDISHSSGKISWISHSLWHLLYTLSPVLQHCVPHSAV